MIILYFTDNDLYKFTTMHAVATLYPEAVVKYRFINRGETLFPHGFAKSLRKEVDQLKKLKMTREEEDFIKKKCYYFPQPFIDLLKGYRYNPDEVKISQKEGKLNVEVEGHWYRTVLWEVPLMAIISELFFKFSGHAPQQVEEKAGTKAFALNAIGAAYSDFGTRRRFSFDVHDRVIKTLKETAGNSLKGTSNVYLAMKHGLTPIGTHPHEWFMYHGAHFGYRMANTKALNAWVDVYHGDLGIALTDTYTTQNFYSNFSTMQAKLFDGVRMDSGDTEEFIEQTIRFYVSKRIDPQTKTIIFSDALNIEKIKAIKQKIKGRIRDGYGIGTYFTNDVGIQPLNMVIKMSEAKPHPRMDYVPVVKISDIREKVTGNEDELILCKKMLNQ
jgi:nicotinate phosphoribosyltransferase